MSILKKKSGGSEKMAWMAVGFLTFRYIYTPLTKVSLLLLIGLAFLTGWAARHHDILTRIVNF